MGSRLQRVAWCDPCKHAGVGEHDPSPDHTDEVITIGGKTRRLDFCDVAWGQLAGPLLDVLDLGTVVEPVPAPVRRGRPSKIRDDGDDGASRHPGAQTGLGDPDGEHACKLCPRYGATSHTALVKHLSERHDMDYAMYRHAIGEASAPKLYTCKLPDCGYTRSRAQSVGLHERHHHPEWHAARNVA